MAPPVVCRSRFARRMRARRCRVSSGVLNKSLGFDRSAAKNVALVSPNLGANGSRSLLAAKPVPPMPLSREQILGGRAGGPNTAHPVTQTVSTPYLRPNPRNGKQSR